jgi:2'-5' RNA ligase
MIRAFLSIDIEDERLINRIVELQDCLDKKASKLKIVEPENLHFTWRFFGDTPVERIESIREALQELEFQSFTITIGGVGAFPNTRRPNVIWVGALENAKMMQELKAATDLLLEKIGYRKETKKFTPHATIARVRQVLDRERASQNLDTLSGEVVGEMVVTSIRMTSSTLTPQGSIYDTLWEIKV